MSVAVARRGIILPVVLFVLLLLGLLAAMFSFRVHADVASTRAIAYRLQTRLAAEAGVERVKVLLRESRMDVDRWYHNPDELHRIIVWLEDGDRSSFGSNEEYDEPGMAYRFSIVADDPTDDEDYIRLGVTDESAKLNLNKATRKQLMILLRAVVEQDEEVDPGEIADAILDWRDKDKIPRGDAGDTEIEYYRLLPVPYFVKNGNFDTVEELLLVKGVTGQILYGEDYDRNGLLTPNEDDGDDTFPPDNQDNVLNRGLYPYLTVLSEENNVANDNRPRVYLGGDTATVQAELTASLPDDPDLVAAIIGALGSGGGGSDNTQGDGNSGGDGNTGNGDGDSGSGPGNTDNAPGDGLGGLLEGLDEGNDGPGDTGTGDLGGGESDNGAGGSTPMRSPASLLLNRPAGDSSFGVSLSLEQLPVLMDRTTMLPADQRTVVGLININTAPPAVLRCIEGLDGEQVGAIMEARGELDSETKETTAWLVTEGVLDLETFDAIAPQITARGQQFRIEALGYGDHTGMVTRLDVVVDMLGPIAETVYYRDLSYLGGHYPIREEDLEDIGVR